MKGDAWSDTGVFDDSLVSPPPPQTFRFIHEESFPMARTAHIQRQTAETTIDLSLDLDGQGQSNIDTGVGFFDHMLDLLSRHGAIDTQIRATGDLQVDHHHTVEDVGICWGQALRQAVGDKSGIRRFGFYTLPMDETLVTAAVDLSGRPVLVYQADFPAPKIGQFDSELVREFWHAVTTNGLLALHIVLHHGQNSHHISEAIFKATARALRAAVERDPRVDGIPSTKGILG
jgi:imidazoleglycerol-phosphate dehydratase